MRTMVPFFDLKAQYEPLRGEILAAVASVFDRQAYILGPEVVELEKEFAAYCGAAHGVGVNSGTSALQLALLAAGVGPGDEVITVPHTFIATVSAIRYCGARPVLVDVDPRTFCMDPAAAARAITPRTKALLPVHIFGHPAALNELIPLAGRHGLPLIEDAAQAHGAELYGQRVGGFGRFGCFSFYPTKNLGAMGEAGMVLTSDEADATRVRRLRDWGASTKYIHDSLGFNMRMEGVQAAVLRVKMRYLDAWTERRRTLAAAYDAALAGMPVTIPYQAPGARHVYHLYVVQMEERDRVQRELATLGVGSAVHYPRPLHLQPVNADLGYRAGDFPVSESLCRASLSLPLYPELSDAQQATVVSALAHIFKRG